MAIRSKEQEYVDKYIYLIPGEKILQSSMLINYFMSLTNYRLYLICKNSDVDTVLDKCCHIGIPINLILKIEKVDFKYLCLSTKIGSIYKLSFDCNENCNLWLRIISESLILKNPRELFAYQYYKYLDKSKSERWLLRGNAAVVGRCDGVSHGHAGQQNGNSKDKSNDLSLVHKEFQRMQFVDECWQITAVNCKFQ